MIQYSNEESISPRVQQTS